jgi:acyl-CoA thioesterase
MRNERPARIKKNKLAVMDEPEISPELILKTMLKRDRFTEWLGLEIDEYKKGYCRLHYLVTDIMLNGFNIIHGGVIFSAADSAFAFACNSHGIRTLALDGTINFTKQAKSGEILTVEAIEVYMGNKIGIYDIRTTNEKGELVALFKGTAYRTSTNIS